MSRLNRPEFCRHSVAALRVDDLYLRLLPTTSEKAYRNKEGTLVSLKVEQGLGRSRIPLKKEEVEEDPDLDEGEPGAEMAAAPRVVKKRSIDSRLRPLLRRRMLAPLRDMGERENIKALEGVASCTPT